MANKKTQKKRAKKEAAPKQPVASYFKHEGNSLVLSGPGLEAFPMRTYEAQLRAAGATEVTANRVVFSTPAQAETVFNALFNGESAWAGLVAKLDAIDELEFGGDGLGRFAETLAKM